MTVTELANRSLMNEDDAELILSRIEGSALWTAEMVVELSLNGFRPAEIHHRMQYDPMFLIAYLAIRESE